jgi:hypothetical protein
MNDFGRPVGIGNLAASAIAGLMRTLVSLGDVSWPLR